MRDISHKITTLRVAHATSVLKMKPSSVQAVQSNTGPKADVPATARAAGYLAVKNTHNAIPHCHPIPVERVVIDLEYGEDTITVSCMVITIYKTGCEMEALHGATVAALVIYDMLKPVDKDIEILSTKLDKKTGGKSDWGSQSGAGVRAAVIVCSDSISAGTKQDKAGKAIMEKLEALEVKIEDYIVLPDDGDTILERVHGYVNAGVELIVTTGGTGLGPRDVTVDVLRPLFDREIPGIMEAARQYGQLRTPYAMLSRSVAGLIGRSLVLCMPGSTKGASETMDALFPYALHIFRVLEKGYRHEEMNKR